MASPIFLKSTEFQHHLEYDHLKYLTIKNYMSQINKYFKLYGTMSAESVKIFLMNSPNPNRISAMRTYLKFVKDSGEDVNEAYKVVKKIKPKPTDRKEIMTLELERGQLFIKHLTNNGKHELAVVCMIIYDTGVRIRGLLKLRKKDIDMLSDGRIYFNFQEKQDKFTRRIVTPETFDRLNKLIILPSLSSETLIFFNRVDVTNKELDKKYYALWKDIREAAKEFFGDEKVTFHWLRRGAGVEIYKESGNDIIAASKFLGDTIQQGEKYLKIQAQKGEEIIKKTKREW